MRLLNDPHIGAIRSAGTTIATAAQLRRELLSNLQGLLPDGDDCLLLGDLFDTHNIPLPDLLAAIQMLQRWCLRNPQFKLINVKGNHDDSKSSNVMSSFAFLSEMLKDSCRNYVEVVEPMMTEWGYIIPHLRNQDLLNLELERVPACKYLFVHCNYDNNFAAQSDQSLNISREQVAALPVEYVVFAHEHKAKVAPKVLIPGNQIASSVSDWLGVTHKQLLMFDKVGDTYQHRFETVLLADGQYEEINWKELRETTAAFVRVVGDATAEEAAAVVSAVSKLRKSSEALVVANAVRIATAEGAVDYETALETVNQFSVHDELKALFTAEEWAILEPLCSPT